MGIFTALSPITAASILLPTGLCRYSQSSKPKLYVVAILGANNAHAESSRQMVNNFTLLHAIISAHPSYVAKDSRWYTTPALQGLKEEETKPEDFPRASTTFETVVRSGSSLVRSKLPSILEKVTQKARQVDKILIVLVGPEFEEQPAMRVGEYLLRCSELEANLNAYPSEADVYCLLPTACRLSMMGCTPDHWSVLVGEGLNKESVSVDDASGFQSSKSREGESIAYNDLPSLCFWNNLGLDNRSCKNVSAVEPSFERCISGFHLLQLKWGPSRIITKLGPILTAAHESRRPVLDSGPPPLESTRHEYLLELIKEFKPRERPSRCSNVAICTLCMRYPRGFDQERAERLIRELEVRKKQAGMVKAICEAVGWDWKKVGDPYLVKEDTSSWDQARRKALEEGFDIARAILVVRKAYGQRHSCTDLTMWMSAVWEANGCTQPHDWNDVVQATVNKAALEEA